MENFLCLILWFSFLFVRVCGGIPFRNDSSNVSLNPTPIYKDDGPVAVRTDDLQRSKTAELSSGRVSISSQPEIKTKVTSLYRLLISPRSAVELPATKFDLPSSSTQSVLKSEIKSKDIDVVSKSKAIDVVSNSKAIDVSKSKAIDAVSTDPLSSKASTKSSSTRTFKYKISKTISEIKILRTRRSIKFQDARMSTTVEPAIETNSSSSSSTEFAKKSSSSVKPRATFAPLKDQTVAHTNATGAPTRHHGLTEEEHAQLSTKASLIVGAVFIPALILLFIFCRFVPGCIGRLTDEK